MTSNERRSDIRRLLTETGRRYAGRYALAFSLLGVVSATTAATAWLMKNVINDVFIAKDPSALIFVAVAVLVIYVARGAASYGQSVLLSRIGNSIVADGQTRLAAKLMKEDVGTILAQTSSEIVQKMTMAVDSMRSTLQVIVTGLGRDILTLIGLVFVMIVQDPLMSLVVLIVMPIAAVLVGGLGKRLRKIFWRQVGISVSISDQLRQIIQGIRVVKAFGVEGMMGERLAATIAEQHRNADKMAGLSSSTQPIVETLAGIAVALVILYGGWRVIVHGATPGEFFSFITALLLAYDPARRIAGARVQVEQGLVGLHMLYEMLDRVPRHADRGEAVPLRLHEGEIRYEEVRFAYEEGIPLLDGINLIVEPGKTTAFVGGSGSGKSTLLSLLLRFWEPQGGRILVDGQEIAGLTAASLRQHMAYVGQDAFLFDGSIRDNLRIGRPDATDEAIIAAAKAAQAHDFILDLPQGYATPVGELASRLSGGQKSRIAIARAFLRDAPILLLDEPTAALDAHAEEAIRITLADLAKGRTTILIAHRLASVIGADKIVVIDAGRVVEQGTHAELLAGNGPYAALYRLQAGEG